MKKLPRFDDLVARVRAVAGALPDPRTGANTQCSMADIALAAFSVFFPPVSFLPEFPAEHGTVPRPQ